MKKQNYVIPDWVPENAGDSFAVKFVKGKSNTEITHTHHSKLKKRIELTEEDYIKGVVEQDRTVLARAITLIESNSSKHQEVAKNVLNRLLPYTGNSLRIGISGVPGAGKSTFIETFGLFLIKQNHKVAVLTIDPSSTLTKGSVLGDKTRMENLSKEKNCFIRPSPSGGTLGGVARKSRETMLLCEAAGYDIILIETVGVGQSEITVRSMVDIFLLLQIAGAGDELQGIKKGVIEISDIIAINKCDGENLKNANIALADFSSAVKYLTPYTPNWQPKVLLISALTGFGIENIWQVIKEFENKVKSENILFERRKEQSIEWLKSLINEFLLQNFYKNKALQKELNTLKNKILGNELTPTFAAEKLIELYNNLR